MKRLLATIPIGVLVVSGCGDMPGSNYMPIESPTSTSTTTSSVPVKN